MVSNQCPFNFNFLFGNRKKSQCAKSGEYSGWRMTAILFFARNCWVRTEVWDGALSWWSSQVCSRQSFGATSSHIFTQSPQNFTVEPRIHSLASWDKSFVHNPLDIKKVMIVLLTLLFTRLAFFVLVTRGFSNGRIVALSQGCNRKPSSHHQWWPRPRRFHHRRQADKVQCRCWRAAASSQLSGSWAQI